MAQDTKTAGTGKAAEDRSRSPGAGGGKVKAPKLEGKDRDMGFALRSVYQRTVEEAVPDDLLDLLSKLD